jgi:crossover junction endodeoxyribonuclease RusA
MEATNGEGTDALGLYENFLSDTPHKFCWWCGRTARDRPREWGALFMLERAHMVNKPRRADRRAVIILCSLCHRIQHGDIFRWLERPIGGAITITLENMLWLKAAADPDYYDPVFLRTCSVRTIPEPVKPTMYDIIEFKSRRPSYFRAPVPGVTAFKGLVITIPGKLDSALSPNSRVHWRVKAKAVKLAKELARIQAHQAQNGRCRYWKEATQHTVVYYKSNKPDGDNSLASMKPIWDGFQKAGLIVDDKDLLHNPITFLKGEPRLEITITPT